MKIINTLLLPIIIATLISCKQKQNESTNNIILNPISKIEKAHHKDQFLSYKAIEFDISVSFMGKEHINAQITSLTNSSKSLITLTNGDKIYINNNKVTHTPNIKNEKMVRFDAYTWSYFFLFPYKLSDKGTKWSKFGTENLNGENKNIQFLNFESGTGDAPDDWYYVYSKPNTNLIDTAAYIVSFGKTKKKAEEEPHAIKYENYTNINSIPFATDWSFWIWNKKEGLTKKIGKASIKNIKFINPDNSLFTYPKHYVNK